VAAAVEAGGGAKGSVAAPSVKVRVGGLAGGIGGGGCRGGWGGGCGGGLAVRRGSGAGEDDELDDNSREEATRL
jgi:hypothetical protein